MQTPLVVLTGYLGAGKTSLLRNLLPRLVADRLVPHVLVNDYRNAWVDARTLEGLAKTVTPIHGSCVCCDSREDLLTALATLTLPARSVVLLEANGTADAIELLELLTVDRRTRRFSLPLQVTVVDARRWQKRYWNNGVEAAQVKTAGFMVMTRRDEVDDRRWAEVGADLAQRNARARIVEPEALPRELVRLVESGVDEPARAAGRLDDAPRDVHHQQHHHQHHFASLELRLPGKVSRVRLQAFLAALPDEVIRAKGIAFLDSEPPEAVLFQKVEGRGEAALMKLGSVDELEPVAVFIGVQCPEPRIRALLQEHLLP